MFKLSKNWLTEGTMDAEYKEYLVLAYLRDVHEVFKNKILYPPLAELIEQYHYLKSIKDNLNNIKTSEKVLTGIDWKNMKLIYGYSNPSSNIQDKTEIDIIEEVIDFSLPKIEKEIHLGKKIYEEVESQMNYSQVGLTPLNKNVGYIFIQNFPTSEILVYRYEISSLYAKIDEQQVPFKSLKTEYISSYTLSISQTLTSIKQEIIQQMPDIPNPAVFSFFPKICVSMEYTILPVVKRMLLKIAS